MLLLLLKFHWKKLLVILLILSIPLAYLGGRLTTPSQVQPSVRLEDTWVYNHKAVEVTKVIKQKAQVKTEVVYWERKKRPDGTEEEKALTRTSVDSKVLEDTSKTLTQLTEAQGKTVSEVKPEGNIWRLGVLAGLATSGTQVGGSSLVFEPVVGLSVERRVTQSFAVGAWGTSEISRFKPTLGISVTLLK